MKAQFRVKICGVTTSDDALRAVEAGADAIGLNFYVRSPRFIDVATAARIRQDVPPSVRLIGVFVNAPVADVAGVVQQAGLDAVQLHGDEPPQCLAEIHSAGGALGMIPILRAFRCRNNGYADMVAYLGKCEQLGGRIDAALIDAFVEGHYGGGGATIDWAAFREAKPQFNGTPVILAGGLTPENIATAIETALPDAVDVASGVEDAPGKKNARAMKRFVENARAAFHNKTAK